MTRHGIPVEPAQAALEAQVRDLATRLVAVEAQLGASPPKPADEGDKPETLNDLAKRIYQKLNRRAPP